MRRVLPLSVVILLLFPALIFSQRDSLHKAFLEAESWFLFEEYTEALPLYQALLTSDPGNDKLKYKMGICLLNDPYQKDKAIRYLLEASKNINPDYKQNNLKERAAPPDVLYYLGNAYLVNELLDQAVESFEEFLEIMDHEVYDEELVLSQIKACKNARRLKSMPVDFDLILLDSLINTRYADIRPVISGDGTKMAFVTKLPFYDGAFFTEKKGESWSNPQIITQMLGFDSDVYPVALSHDGTEMILYYDDDYIGNLYYSRLVNGQWIPASKLDENISTRYWESHACFSRDGKTLFFTSNRKGGYGGLDIYRSERQAGGKWGPPVNLGSTINTPYNEESPYISEDGQTLFFSSYGHYNMGGYDIFCSGKKANGTWSDPVNLGYPINTTDDDLYFQPVDDGSAAYYAVYSPRGIGLHDIYYMNIYSENNPRFYPVSGRLRMEGPGEDSPPVTLYAVDLENGHRVDYPSPDKEGAFSMKLVQGNYELHFLAEGYAELIKPLRITRESNMNGIKLGEDLVMSLEAAKAEAVRQSEQLVTELEQPEVEETPLELPVDLPNVAPAEDPGISEELVKEKEEPAMVVEQDREDSIRTEEAQGKPLSGTKKTYWPLVGILAISASGLIFMVLAWRKRRDKGHKQAD